MADDPRDASGVSRIVLRPIGTPLPLGFLGLLVASAAYTALQLDWIPAAQGSAVALAVLVLTVPVQAVAALYGFLARDPVAGTGMGIMAGAWAATAVVTWTAPPGATSPGLGVVLLAAGVAMVVPAAAGTTKLVAAGVMGLSAVRFAATGVAELTGSPAWTTTAGWVGAVLAVAAFYAALALELEDARGRTVLPVLRRGRGRAALDGDVGDQLRGLASEAGVRDQL